MMSKTPIKKEGRQWWKKDNEWLGREKRWPQSQEFIVAYAHSPTLSFRRLRVGVIMPAGPYETATYHTREIQFLSRHFNVTRAIP